MLVCRLLRNVRPATSIATLRCKTVPGQAGHRLADALRSIGPRAARLLTQTRPHALKGKAVTVSSQLFRALRPLHNCQLTVLVYPPWPPRGKIIARERGCQFDRQCPDSAFHNIIPSVLCNIRQQPDCYAVTASIREGQKPARPSSPAADYTIRIMLRTLRRQGAEVLPSNSRARRRRTRHSREGGTTPPSTRARRTLREHYSTVSALIRGRKVPPRRPSSRCEGYHSLSASLLCGQVRCLRHLRCWVVPGRDSSSSAGSVRRVPSLHSAVSLRLVYTWPLLLHTSAGVNPARSVPGVQDAAVPAAGAACTHRYQDSKVIP